MDSETESLSFVTEVCGAEGDAARVRCLCSVGVSPLGDPDVGWEAARLLSAVDVVLRHEGNRRSDELFVLPLERLFRHLEIGLHVHADPGLDYGSDWQRYLRFQAVPREAPTFAGWTVFVVENGQLGRLVWRAPGQSELQQAFVEQGELDAALKRLRMELLVKRSVAPVSGERVKGKLRDVG